MKKITVFTPTYNRAATLTRVYDSLLVQTCKDFIWLIIDDGSTDNTKQIVDQWIKDNLISISYHFKENGGKHTAMRMANQVCGTKYLTLLDSDDAFVPEAVEVFIEEWNSIEKHDLEESIAEIRAYTMFPTGEILGNYRLPEAEAFVDDTWQKMILKNKNDNEYLCSWNLEKLKKIIISNEVFWFEDKIKFLPEFVLWARLGRLYKTRYLNQSLRYYYTDGGNSLLRAEKPENAYYPDLVGYKYFIDENIQYLLWRPEYFLRSLIKFSVSGLILAIPFSVMLKAIHSARFKIWYVSFYPLAVLVFIYYNLFKKNYWS